MNAASRAARHDAVELGQSERPARRRADHLGARHGDPRARADPRELPEYDFYWHIPAIKFGQRVMRNYNTLIDRYPGADGMKTGFICASGFNLVATATRNGRTADRRGARRALRRDRAPRRPRSCSSAASAAAALSWLMPSLGTVDALQPIAAAPPNLRDEMCGKDRKRPAAEEEDDESAVRREQPTSIRARAFAATLQSLRGRRCKTGPLLGAVMHGAAPIPVVGRRATGSAQATHESPIATQQEEARHAETRGRAEADRSRSRDRGEAAEAGSRKLRGDQPRPRSDQRTIQAGLREDDARRGTGARSGAEPTGERRSREAAKPAAKRRQAGTTKARRPQ